MGKHFMAVVVAAGAGLLAGACATDPLQAGATREEPVYLTGSNIARHRAANDGSVSTLSAEQYERVRSSVTPPIPQPVTHGR